MKSWANVSDCRLSDGVCMLTAYKCMRGVLLPVRDKYGDIVGVDDDKLARMAERARKYGKRESEALLDEGSESESSSSDEEDETAELLTPEMDAQIMKALLALRNKDPSVYDSQTNFYSGNCFYVAAVCARVCVCMVNCKPG